MTQWRKATWALAIWNVLMMLWLATAIGGVGSLQLRRRDRRGPGGVQGGSRHRRDVRCHFVLIVWLIGFIAFGLVWLMSRPKSYGQ